MKYLGLILALTAAAPAYASGCYDTEPARLLLRSGLEPFRGVFPTVAGASLPGDGRVSLEIGNADCDAPDVEDRRLKLEAKLGQSVMLVRGSNDSSILGPLTSEQAKVGDAHRIAAATGISVTEAAKRGTLQHATANLARSLREQYRDRLAGLYREWTPTPHFVVRLKGQPGEAARVYSYQSLVFEVRFVSGATHTLVELAKARELTADAIQAAFPTLQATATDERTGELVLSVLDDGDAAALAARAAAISGIPTRVETGVSVKLLPRQ